MSAVLFAPVAFAQQPPKPAPPAEPPVEAVPEVEEFVEWYYTGVQRLEHNSYRESSEPYMIVGLMGEKQFGRIRLFVNGENLTGVRQTKWDPLLRPDRAPDGWWTVDAWAPLDGRTVNGGVRLMW